jgi:O-antigen ligase
MKVHNLRLSFNQIYIAIFVIPLAISPLISYDAINIPKATILTLIAFSAIPVVIINYKQLIHQKKIIILNIVAICSWACLILFVHRDDFTEELYGVDGRRIGFLTTIGLLILFVVSIILSDKTKKHRTLDAIMLSGTINIIYTVFQKSGLDPIKWKTQETTIFGFMGNTNFNSSYLAVTCLAIFNKILQKNVYYIQRLLLVLLFCLGVFSIHLTDSIQGFFVLSIGIATHTLIQIYNSRKYFKFWPYFLSSIITCFVLIIFGIFQKNLLSGIFYQNSTSYRGDYWRASWEMAQANLVFGVGFSGFRDNYKMYRDEVAASRSIGSFEVDSPHNFFLDLLTSGGVFYLFLHLVLLGTVLILIIKHIKNKKFEIESEFSSFVGIWIGLMAQFFVSPNNIALLSIFWIVTGLLVGSVSLKTQEFRSVKDKSERKNYKASTSLFLVIGLTLSVPLFYSDMIFRKSVESGKIEYIIASTNTFPKSVENLVFTSRILRENGFEQEALIQSRRALEHNSKNLEAWQEFSSNQLINDFELRNASEMIRKLDPYNYLTK